MIVSPKLIGELRTVLSRKKFDTYSAEGRGESYANIFESDAIVVDDPSHAPAVTPDPDDDYLFALALSANASHVVSGDRHLTELEDPTPPVLTPRQFVELLSQA